jgi:hypothetical protein
MHYNSVQLVSLKIMDPLEVMNKVLSKSDATNDRLEFPSRSLGGFPISAYSRSFVFEALDVLGESWSLNHSSDKVSKNLDTWSMGDLRS